MVGPKRAEPPKIPPNIVLLIERAEHFKELLDSGVVRNRADLAKTFRLTRARVTQLLQLLDLHPTILAYGKSLPPGTPTKMVTERGLRPLLGVPMDRQLRVARRQVSGFTEYLNESRLDDGKGRPPGISPRG
jgi:hypothetical protein